jgi:hypothetical protein
VALFNGTDVTGNVTVGLADSTGAPITAAKSASTAGSGTDAYQRIPFAVAYAAKGPALYYIQVQYSSGTARYNTHHVGNFACTKQTGRPTARSRRSRRLRPSPPTSATWRRSTKQATARGAAFMGAINLVSASLVAENTFTDVMSRVVGPAFNVSISGTWAGTLMLQRRLDGTNWRDVETFTANVETEWPTKGDHVEWRLGFKTGAYTSGTAVVRLDN